MRSVTINWFGSKVERIRAGFLQLDSFQKALY